MSRVRETAGAEVVGLSARDGRTVLHLLQNSCTFRWSARAEGEVNDTDARLWHPWLRINRLLRAMLHER